MLGLGDAAPGPYTCGLYTSLLGTRRRTGAAPAESSAPPQHASCCSGTGLQLACTPSTKMSRRGAMAWKAAPMRSAARRQSVSLLSSPLSHRRA